MQGKRRTWVAVIGGIAAVALAIGITMGMNSQSTLMDSQTGPKVFAVDSEPYGTSYAEWTAKWWTWLLTEPDATNPNNDETGEWCALNQNDPNVFFIAGTWGGSAERDCTVPAGKALLGSSANADCSTKENPGETDLQSCAESAIKGATVQASVDGVKVQNLEQYWVCSSEFSMVLPEGNTLGVSAGETDIVSCGYWFFLEPLSPGEHELRFSGSKTDPVGGTQAFAFEVIDQLTVK